MGMKTMIFLGEKLDFNMIAMKTRIICIDNMAICIWLFHLLQVLALSETYIMICLDQTISKGISELIWIYGIFMQHGFAGSHWTVKYER